MAACRDEWRPRRLRIPMRGYEQSTSDFPVLMENVTNPHEGL